MRIKACDLVVGQVFKFRDSHSAEFVVSSIDGYNIYYHSILPRFEKHIKVFKSAYMSVSVFPYEKCLQQSLF